MPPEPDPPEKNEDLYSDHSGGDAVAISVEEGIVAPDAQQVTPQQFRKMVERAWWTVYEAPVPEYRSDPFVIIDLAKTYARNRLDRLEAATVAYLRACKAGKDWPADPSLSTLQKKLGRYVLMIPAAQPEPQPETLPVPAQVSSSQPDAEPQRPVWVVEQEGVFWTPGSIPSPSPELVSWWQAHDPQMLSEAEDFLGRRLSQREVRCG